MAYGDTIVLDAIDLDITSGQVVALLGPNGAGKTTTIEILEGFRRRSVGTSGCWASIPSRRPRRGEPGSEWCCRAGVTTDPGGWRNCWT